MKVVNKKLGREKALGQTWPNDKNPTIEIEERIKNPKTRMGVLLHELLHIAYPEMSEKQILKGERVLRNGMWKDNYRQVKNDTTR